MEYCYFLIHNLTYEATIKLHSFFSLPFWNLWFLIHMKDFYPFQISYLCFIHIGIKFNDCGLVVKLQNSFESLKLGFHCIIFLIYNICSVWSVKIYNFLTVTGENDSSLYYSQKYYFLNLGFVSSQTVGTAAVWTRVPPAGSSGGLGCLVCWWPQPEFGWLYLHSHVTLHPRCL